MFFSPHLSLAYFSVFCSFLFCFCFSQFLWCSFLMWNSLMMALQTCRPSATASSVQRILLLQTSFLCALGLGMLFFFLVFFDICRMQGLGFSSVPVNTFNSFSQLPVFQLCEALTVGKCCTCWAWSKIQNIIRISILLFTRLEQSVFKNTPNNKRCRTCRGTGLELIWAALFIENGLTCLSWLSVPPISPDSWPSCLLFGWNH